MVTLTACRVLAQGASCQTIAACREEEGGGGIVARGHKSKVWGERYTSSLPQRYVHRRDSFGVREEEGVRDLAAMSGRQNHLSVRCTAPLYLAAGCVAVSELAHRRHLHSAAVHQLVVPSELM